MKKLFSMVFALCLLLCLASCAQRPEQKDPDSSSQPASEPEVVGDDWHVWGMYDFATVGDIKVAIEKAYNEDNQIIGYNLYADGESLGPLVGKIRGDDTKYLPEELDTEGEWKFKDFNNDELIDIGVPIRNGDFIWYIRNSGDEISFSSFGASTALADTAVDWHDWGVFDFKSFDDGMTVAISKTGEDGKEVGFNVFADLGPDIGANLCKIRFADGGYTLADFDLKDCVILNDYNADGLGDIGVKTKSGDIMCYLRDSARRFNYTETQKAE